ncbi:MAG: DUF4445 domain-containing protein [Clostridiaceae bacterium]|nr:DUF4445 domain-containing protein [Clostridiaceae bacterium]
MPAITIHHNNETKMITAMNNTMLLDVLRKHGYSVEAPCNGKGICGKCRIKILQGTVPYTLEERKHLSSEELNNGIHLACMIKVTGDMEISLGLGNENASVLTEAGMVPVSGKPVMRKEFTKLPAPSLNDQRTDSERLISVAGGDSFDRSALGKNTCLNAIFPLDLVQKLPEILRRNDYHVTTIQLMEQIIGVESGNTTKILYGVAIDIGTTTMAAYIYDLSNGEKLSVASMLNPQKKFGADVISRIDYASKSRAHAAELSGIIRNALNELIGRLVQQSNLNATDVYLVSLAGNTTMLHLLLELPAIYLATAPFIPATLSVMALKPMELNLSINPQGRILILPGVSAYVGADTVAAVVSTGMAQREEVTLLVDIGTNGEIVLGNRDFLYSCSTAAGPAFEGANIVCGTGGVEGAVSEVFVTDDGSVQWKTIGGKEPVGICGSGLIDAIACMLQIGILDDTGRILDREELDQNTMRYADRLFEFNGQQAFLLGEPSSRRVFITQKDVREVQNAKAAIAAGINVLLQESGVSSDDVHSVFLAGGFGSFMNITSAVKTGLLPKGLVGRIHAVGNAAGAGTILSLLSQEALISANAVARQIKYLELSSRQDFVSEYTENMFFDIG